MSSKYRLICLSHDPGIVIADHEWDARCQVDEQVTEGHPALQDHRWCDVMVGRWSGALVEVGCFGMGQGAALRSSCRMHHHGINWADKDLLRLIWYAHMVSEQGVIVSHGGSGTAHTGVAGGGVSSYEMVAQGGQGGSSSFAYGQGGGGGGSVQTERTIPPGILEPFTGGCWPIHRIARLRYELGLEQRT